MLLLPIMILTEAIVTIVDSFAIVCFPITNLLILLVLHLHCSMFTVVVNLKIEPHLDILDAV